MTAIRSPVSRSLSAVGRASSRLPEPHLTVLLGRFRTLVEPVPLSLSAAAKLAGKGKSTIHAAIKSGKLSAARNDDGTYSIDPAELARAFTLNPVGTFKPNDPEPRAEPLEIEVAVLRSKLASAEDQLGRERETVADLRARLDRSEERVLALTHQSASAPAKPKGLLSRLLGRA